VVKQIGYTKQKLAKEVNYEKSVYGFIYINDDVCESINNLCRTGGEDG